MLHPQPASSAILRRGDRLLLVRRVNPPLKDMYAFPGGRAEAGETPDVTALREMREETGIEARNPRLFATYDLPSRGRDGRLTSHFLLSVFVVEAESDAKAVAADDAADAGWFSLDEIRRLRCPDSVVECAERVLGRLHEMPESALASGPTS